MHILFITPYAPNPVRVRPYEFIRTLLRRGHRVTLAALWTSERERADLAHLADAGATVISAPMPASQSLRNSAVTLLRTTPLQAAYSWNPALMTQIAGCLQPAPGDARPKIDAVHVEHLRGSRYAIGVRRLLTEHPDLPRVPIVWDSVDSISYLFEQTVQTSRSLKARLMTWLELGRTRRHEAWLIGQFERTLVTSRLDKAAFERLLLEHDAGDGHALAARIAIVPNGVDLEHFAFRSPQDRPANRIIFSGKMSYHANVTAALHLVNDIMPQVWAQRPDVQVWLVGKDPTPAVSKLAQASAPGGAPRVVVTGGVPQMPEYIQGATIAAAPLLYGAGIQNKALEALACGTPVVASRQATAALGAQHGRDLLVAEGAADFAAALLTLLADPALRASLGAAGRRYVEENHSWGAAAARLEAAYALPPL